MVFNTLTVGAAVTPSVIETYFSHYLNRAPLRQKPTAHVSYHEGLRLIRQFLDYSSKHSVEDLQSFTGQFVPSPHWVRINDAEVAPKFLDRAAKLVQDQLGHKGCDRVGGRTWWQWRRPESPLRAEWIEMKKEYHERKRTGAKCERVILYVHGGAYYFGSVDAHRYQMQRHARKLRARVLAPRYRLAPQFPFPCGLYDCLATYYYLLEHFDPSQILFAGDSAGGGMVLSMLVTLRDQGQPLPAGTILLSPWVDMTHSFPSVAGDGAGDYIPPHGFLHKPSMAWPPPPTDESKKSSSTFGTPSDAVELPGTAGLDMKKRSRKKKGVDGVDDDDDDDDDEEEAKPTRARKQPVYTAPLFGNNLGIVLDGKTIEMKEQLQLYTTNELLAHPLVSPVIQPSLGGLPPMLIQIGGAELLRDEQIYLAHKAANPKAYPPSDAVMKEYDIQGQTLERYPPTDVQLQVWDDLCHVPHTLSFTRPAKYMYRSVAQFGAWALAHAQHKGIDMQDDDAVSIISSGDEEDDDAKSILERKGTNSDINSVSNMSINKLRLLAQGAVGKAGDPLPPFKDHMIRQRVTRHGVIFPLPPPSEMASLALDPASIGTIKSGPVRKWLAAKAANDLRFASDRKKVEKKRAKEFAAGYDTIPGESPPPTALAGRRRKGIAPEEKKKGKSWGLAMWSGWGSSHDEHTLQREEKNAAAASEGSRSREHSTANGKASASTNHLAVPNGDAANGSKKQRRTSSASMLSAQMPWAQRDRDRPRSPFRQVNDTGQASSDANIAKVNGSPVIPPGSSSARSARSRRTSGSGSIANSTSVSVAGANSPIPVEGERRDRGRSFDAPMLAVPTTFVTSPQSEKISGSDNTFLSPGGSRPHNGSQAYPFKLRTPASNPSLATLDSFQAPSPRGASTPGSGTHSELAGDSPMPVELPSAAENRDEVPHQPRSGAASLEHQSISTDLTESEREASPERVAPAAVVVVNEPQAMLKPEIVEDIVSPLDTPRAEIPEGVVSPIEKMKTPAPFLRNTIFDPRTSMLGSLGADGMPNAHHDFPVRNTISGPPSGAPPFISADEESVPPVPLSVTKDENTKVAESDGGVSPVDGSKAAPFRLRNQVFDARAASPSRPQQATENAPIAPSLPPPVAPTKEAGKPAEAAKAAPFKMRHTVYEPNVTLAKGQPASDEPMPTLPTPTSPSEKEVARNPADERKPSSETAASSSPSPSEQPPPAYDNLPKTNVIMPKTVSTRRPVVRRREKENETPPPTPPPKDDKPYASAKSMSGLKSSGKKGTGTTSASPKTAPAATTTVAPRSKFGATPVLGDFSFEKKNAGAGLAEGEKERPQLESFVTASEESDLKG